MYLVVKSFHIISIISWMAGMLYLPRLFIYHHGVGKESEMGLKFGLMEKRLLYYIMWPAMISSVVTGVWLSIETGDLGKSVWLHVKLLFVIILVCCHMLMNRWWYKFKTDTSFVSQLWLRIFNECITFCMIFIVFLVVLRPF